MDLESLLEPMGTSLADYAGEGQVRLTDGSAHACEFLARQTTDGDLLIVLGSKPGQWVLHMMVSGEAVERFEGQTSEGARVTTGGRVLDRNLPPEEKKVSASWAAISLSSLSVHHSDVPATETRFGLTNVWLPLPHSLVLDLEGNRGPAQAEIRRLKGGQNLFKKVKATRGIDVTGELVFPAEASEPLRQAADDICYLLSIAQGSVVTWLYQDEYADGTLVRRAHHHRKTREYAPIPSIDTSALSWPIDFVESTYPTYTRRRDSWELDRGPIDWYLEARPEADYLEPRAAKLALALETLKHRYLHSGDSTISEFIIPQNDFKDIASDLQSAIATYLNSETDLESKQSSKIAGKLPGMNRESFRQVLLSLLDLLDLELEGDELQQFLDSRNCLVHQGQFYCKAVEKDEATVRSDPLPSVSAEYYFMVYVLDRIVLSLVGYNGEHRDWRAFPEEKKFVAVRR